jgi:hypothetical protein
MFIFRGEFEAENLLPDIHLLPLSVYFLDKRRHHGAILHEVVGACVFLEVFIYLIETVEAT